MKGTFVQRVAIYWRSVVGGSKFYTYVEQTTPIVVLTNIYSQIGTQILYLVPLCCVQS